VSLADDLAHALAAGPLSAETALIALRKVKKPPKGSDPLGQLRYQLAVNRERFERVPGGVGLYRLKPAP
jgi:hypothetical protein